MKIKAMNRSETETQLVTPSSPHNSSSSSSSSSISCIGPYEALDSSEEERVLTPTYPGTMKNVTMRLWKKAVRPVRLGKIKFRFLLDFTVCFVVTKF